MAKQRATARFRGWARRFRNPAFAGVIGSGIGLLIAVFPEVTTGPVRFAAVVVTLAAIAYTVVVQNRSISDQERDERKQFARDARQWSHEIFDVIRDCLSLELARDASLRRQQLPNDELLSKLEIAYQFASDRYFKIYRFHIPNFLEDLDQAGLLADSGALELARKMARSQVQLAFDDIQRLSEYLTAVAYGADWRHGTTMRQSGFAPKGGLTSD